MSTAEHIPQVLQTSIAEAGALARAQQSPALEPSERGALIDEIKRMLAEQNAVLVAHYYVDSELQDLADATGGHVADSLEMARFGYEHQAQTIIVAGVRFMGETAKILSPEKRVLMLDMKANCSLDLGCPVEKFAAFCDANPDRTVIVYANTSAAVKARADWVVTSSIALKLVRHLHEQGKKMLWAPDRYLGDYVRRHSGADILLWQGACIVHEEFKAIALKSLMRQHPDAAVLVHPESPPGVIELADVVGSTSQIIQAAKTMAARKLIVATEDGIFHKMRQGVPEKTLMSAPTAGEGATCESCAHCPWMKLNDLRRLAQVLRSGGEEILVDEQIRRRAEVSIKRMLTFAKQAGISSQVAGNA